MLIPHSGEESVVISYGILAAKIIQKMKRTADIQDFLQPLRDKPYQAYLSNALQVADVLEWTLQQLGKSEVWQTSFSISEEFIRRLFFIEKSGLVTRFNLVLDHKATNKTLKLWAFITQVINTFLGSEDDSYFLTAIPHRLKKSHYLCPCLSFETDKTF